MKALVIGAGMGGLCAALALQRQGIEVEVHEQAGALREVGAGLTLSRGALRSLHAIGVLDAVLAVSRLSASMPFVHYQTARLLWGSFPGPEEEAGDGVLDGDDPFIARHVFRADLQRALSQALQARAPGALRLGHGLARFEQHADGVIVHFANGERTTGDVLIGADGLNSVVRAALWGAAAPAYTGQVAWRFLLDGALARPHLSTGRATVFVGPDCTFNRYTLRGGEILNCVAIVRTPGWHGEGWAIPGDPGELAALSGVPYFGGTQKAEWRARLVHETQLTESFDQFRARWAYFIEGRTPGLSLARAFDCFVDELRAYPREWWAHHALFGYGAAARLAGVRQPVCILNLASALAGPSRDAAALLPNARVAELPQLGGAPFDLGAALLAQEIEAFLGST